MSQTVSKKRNSVAAALRNRSGGLLKRRKIDSEQINSSMVQRYNRETSTKFDISSMLLTKSINKTVMPNTKQEIIKPLSDIELLLAQEEQEKLKIIEKYKDYELQVRYDKDGSVIPLTVQDVEAVKEMWRCVDYKPPFKLLFTRGNIVERKKFYEIQIRGERDFITINDKSQKVAAYYQAENKMAQLNLLLFGKHRNNKYWIHPKTQTCTIELRQHRDQENTRTMTIDILDLQKFRQKVWQFELDRQQQPVAYHFDFASKRKTFVDRMLYKSKDLQFADNDCLNFCRNNVSIPSDDRSRQMMPHVNIATMDMARLFRTGRFSIGKKLWNDLCVFASQSEEQCEKLAIKLASALRHNFDKVPAPQFEREELFQSFHQSMQPDQIGRECKNQFKFGAHFMSAAMYERDCKEQEVTNQSVQEMFRADDQKMWRELIKFCLRKKETLFNAQSLRTALIQHFDAPTFFPTGVASSLFKKFLAEKENAIVFDINGEYGARMIAGWAQPNISEFVTVFDDRQKIIGGKKMIQWLQTNALNKSTQNIDTNSVTTPKRQFHCVDMNKFLDNHCSKKCDLLFSSVPDFSRVHSNKWTDEKYFRDILSMFVNRCWYAMSDKSVCVMYINAFERSYTVFKWLKQVIDAHQRMEVIEMVDVETRNRHNKIQIDAYFVVKREK